MNVTPESVALAAFLERKRKKAQRAIRDRAYFEKHVRKPNIIKSRRKTP